MKTQLVIAASFLAIVLIARLPTFFRSVMDWDESLYFLIAAAWRAGHLPYTTIWDNKPIGIYAILAMFQAVFGERIAAMRIASVGFVTVSAFAVVKITYAVASPASRRPLPCAILAGGTFILGTMSNDGLAANTELFMACFTTLAVLTAVSPPNISYHYLNASAAGLLLGCAFMVKYVAVFEAPAVLFLIILQHPRRCWTAVTVATIFGAALPLAAAVLLYWHAGQLDLWWDDSIVSNFRRLAPPVPAGAVTAATHLQLARWGLLFLPAGILLATVPAPLRGLWQTRCLTTAQGNHLFLSLWLVGGSLGVAAAKSFYDHYFLQILPVLCITLGWLLARVLPRITSWPRYALPLVLILVLLLPVVAAWHALLDAVSPLILSGQHYYVWQADAPERIARDIEAAAMPPQAGVTGPQIYVFDGQPIIYALAGQPSPTHYILPSVLTKNFLPHVANIDAAAEVARILAENPLYIIRDRHPPVNPKTVNQTVYVELEQALAARYRFWRRYGDMDVYQLIVQAGAGR